MLFDSAKHSNLLYNAHVCARCGYHAEAEKLKAEADKMLKAYIAFLDKQAGIERS